jgi:threonine aldolase
MDTAFTSAPYNPLTQQHCDNCTKVIQVANDALQLARKCRDCGYPVDDIIAQLEAQMAQAVKIKQQFFPTSP